MLILPLIVSSIISSLAQLDAQSSGKMGVRALVYYFGTTILAAIVGIILVLIIRPGTRSGPVKKKANSKAAEGRTVDTILDLFRYAFSLIHLLAHCRRALPCIEICFPRTSWRPHFDR